MAKANNVTLAQDREVMNKDNKIEELRQNILLKKAVDFLVEQAIIEE